LIVLVSAPDAPIADKLARYYLDSDIQHERWDRLVGDLNWIYLDTYFLFTKWERVWAAVKKNLKAKVTVILFLKCHTFGILTRVIGKVLPVIFGAHFAANSPIA
jgi:hypothetical protein